MTPTKILSIVLSSTEPYNTIPIEGVVEHRTGSNCEPSHISMVPGKSVTVVFKTKVNLKVVGEVNNEVVVTKGVSGVKYILVVLDQSNTVDWTIVIRTNKESPGSGDTFIAGNGIGLKS